MTAPTFLDSMECLWNGRSFLIRPYLKSETVVSVLILEDGLRPITDQRPEFENDEEAFDWAFTFIKGYTKRDVSK